MVGNDGFRRCSSNRSPIQSQKWTDDEMCHLDHSFQAYVRCLHDIPTNLFFHEQLSHTLKNFKLMHF